MLRILLAGLTVILVGAAEDAKSDAKMLQGTWLMVSGVDNGKKLDEDFVKKSKLVVKGDRHTVTLGIQTIDGSQKLDPSKTPNTIDIRWADGADFYGIYELTDNEFKICISAWKAAARRLHGDRRVRPDGARLEAREEVTIRDQANSHLLGHPRNAPKGHRAVATGGAARWRSRLPRNPWIHRVIVIAPAGAKVTCLRRCNVNHRASGRSRRPSRGGVMCFVAPRVSLCSTRGYNPLPLSGQKVTAQDGLSKYCTFKACASLKQTFERRF